MGMNNSLKYLSPSIIALIISGLMTYYGSQLVVAEKLGDKVSRAELKEAVRDTRDQIQRELNDIKENQKAVQEDIKETNRLLRQMILKK